MSMKEEVRTLRAPLPSGPYSQGLRVDGWIFVSGQGPVDSTSGAIVGTTIEQQTQATLENVRAILEAAGATINDVVKVTAHLKTMGDFERFNAEYAKVFSDPKPVRTTVGSELIDILVEIDVIARLPE
jgi:2-iminobutanoate/2-iminopropanoate deaminase